MGKKKGSSKKSSKTALIPIVAIGLILVLLSSMYYATVNAVAEIMTTVLSSLSNFFSHPIKTIQQTVGTFTNFISRTFNGSSFSTNTNKYVNYKLEPTITMDLQQFEDMSETLVEAVSKNVIGLDDITIKKMLLTYYRTIYLSEYNIRIEVTPEEYKELKARERLYQ